MQEEKKTNTNLIIQIENPFDENNNFSDISSQDESVTKPNSDLILPQENPENIVANNFFENKKKTRGRKKVTEENVYTEHTKFTQDNILRKLKVHHLNFYLSLLNRVIRNERFKLGKNPYSYKKLRKLDSKFVKDIRVELVKSTMELSLADIFKSNSNEKLMSEHKNINTEIIDEIMRDPRYIETQNILKMNYRDSFKAWIEPNFASKCGINYSYSDLKGFSDLLKSIENDKEYYELFERYAHNFEYYLTQRKGRKSKKHNQTQ